MTRTLSLLFCLATVTFGQDVVDSIVYDSGTEWQLFPSEGPVTAFAVAGATIWYGTGALVASLNTKTGRVETFSALGSLDAAGVNTMVAGKNGSVWIGTPGGLALRRGNSFTVYTTEEGLPDNTVNALFLTAGGALWVGTNKGAAVREGNSWRTYSAQSGLPGPVVHSFAEDHRGAVWVGTNKGIGVLHQGTWTVHSMKSGLSWNNTRALAADHREEEIWAAVGEKDVNRYNGKEWQVYMDVQEEIADVMVDTQSRIWFGSPGGVLKFNGEEWISDPAKLGIPGMTVSDMYRDSGGNLWFGSENGIVLLKNPYPF